MLALVNARGVHGALAAGWASGDEAMAGATKGRVMSRRVGRSVVGRVVGRGRGRAVSALGVAMCAVAVPVVVVALPGVAAAQDSASYVFAQGAKTVQGAVTSTDAAELKAGKTYRSSIEAGVKGTGLGSGSGAKGAAGDALLPRRPGRFLRYVCLGGGGAEGRGGREGGVQRQHFRDPAGSAGQSL